MSESKEVGKKLQNARKRAGLTQEQTADLLNKFLPKIRHKAKIVAF